jgi:cell division protein FtsI (penicillin-binding protein 3)
VVDEINDINQKSEPVESDYDQYYAIAQKYITIMPNLRGMSAMDAIAILENMGLKVQVKGSGTVSRQSIKSGQKVKANTTITLELS